MRAVLISPGGEVVMHSEAGMLHVVTMNGLRVASRHVEHLINCMTVTQDAEWLVAGTEHGDIQVQ